MGAPKDSLETLRAEVAVTTRARTFNEARRRGPERSRREALRALEAQLARLPPRPHVPACSAGCAMCCHLRVAVTPAEVFGLLDHLHATLPGPGWEAFRERVRETAAAVHGLPPDRLLATNLACPVLVSGRCSGYAGRPLNCRAYHSLDLAACEQSFAHPGDLGLGHPQDAAVARVNQGVQRGFIDGLGQAGFDVARYELATALAEALEDPAARSRFAAGGTTFTRALRL